MVFHCEVNLFQYGSIRFILLFNIVTFYCIFECKKYVYVRGERGQIMYVTFRGQKLASSFQLIPQTVSLVVSCGNA